MINRKLICKILGSLLLLESLFMLVCLLVSVMYHEDALYSFVVSILVTLFAAVIFHFIGTKADNNMSRRDAFLVVTLSWSVFSLFGSLPFLIGGYIENFTNAYFETMSGFTTTGATIIDDVESLPHGILFWRSFTQWIGGLGIVFFTIAVLPSLVGGSVKVFAAEATGPIKSKLHPKLSTSAKSIWTIFLTLSLACIGSYKLLGMGWFDSVNYAMTTIATGGFTTHNASIEFFNSPALEYVSTLFCFISGINFVLLYRAVIRGDFRNFFTNSELKFYCLMVALFTVFITAMLVIRNHYDIEHAFRCGIYQVVSFMTTTGLFNDDAAQWPHVTWVVLAVCMFMGACAGSTSGGFKSVRCVMLLKVVRNEFQQMLHPKAVLPLRFAGVNVPMQRRVTLLAFLTVYCLLCIICAFIMIAAGVDNTNAITITISTLSNVGPTLGLEIGPTMSWNELPDFAKWICSVLMLMGRLEIFSVLIIFTPTFWQDR
ncbi:MAG: TrkH family potassium uptake protein [Prevotella sp.]|nr:TrkH family potassium uptake protein [Prevotella sp.]MBQ9560796.1 TrkH family potassium uptake protein [Prevotella sp.]MBR1839389.1 TrkH family potassium uptake protein [Prevotella sp.]